MNHIVLAGEHLLVVFTEDGEYPLPEDKNADTGIIDITNWPFDIMRVNETNCMVFADPAYMSTFDTGFTSNGELINNALIFRDNKLYRNDAGNELHQIASFPTPWLNLSEQYYEDHYRKELYEEIKNLMQRADNINDAKVYQDELTVKALKVFLKHCPAARHAYTINVRTGGMSRQYRKRLTA